MATIVALNLDSSLYRSSDDSVLPFVHTFANLSYSQLQEHQRLSTFVDLSLFDSFATHRMSKESWAFVFRLFYADPRG